MEKNGSRHLDLRFRFSFPTLGGLPSELHNLKRQFVVEVHLPIDSNVLAITSFEESLLPA